MFGSDPNEHARLHMLQTNELFFLPIWIGTDLNKNPIVIGRKTRFQIHGDSYRYAIVYSAHLLKPILVS